MKMLMKEFIEAYCQDIMREAEFKRSFPTDFFRFDTVNEDGVGVIFDAEGHEIPIEEILELPFSEFVKKYHHQSSAVAFKNYVSAYINTVGEDVVLQLAKEAQQARIKLAEYRNKDIDDLLAL